MDSEDEDEINQFLKKSILKHFQSNHIDEQRLFDIAKSIKVSNTLMERLDSLYQNHFPQLKMNLKIKRIRISSNKQKTIIELEKQQSISNNYNSNENCVIDEEAANDANKELNNNQIFNRRATYELNYYIGGQKRQGSSSQIAQPSQLTQAKTQQLGQIQQQLQPQTQNVNNNQNNEAAPYEIPSQQPMTKRHSDIQHNSNNNSAIKALKITKIIGQSHIPYSRTNNSVILNTQGNNNTNNNFSQLYQTPSKSQQSTNQQGSTNINSANNNLTFNVPNNTINFTDSNDNTTTNRQTTYEMRTSILRDTELQLPSLQTQTTMSSQHQLNPFQNSSVTSSTVESQAKKNDLTCGTRFSNIFSQYTNTHREESQFGQLNNQQQAVYTMKSQQNNNTYQLSSIPEQTMNCCEQQIFQSNNGLASSYMPENSSTTSEISKYQQFTNQNHLQYYNYNNNGIAWHSSNSIVLQHQESTVSNNQNQQQPSLTQSNERITLSMLNQMNKSKNQSKEVSPTATITRSEEQPLERAQVINLIPVKKNSEIMGVASSSNLQSQAMVKNRSETSSQVQIKSNFEDKSPLTLKSQQRLQQVSAQKKSQIFQQSQRGQFGNNQNAESNSFFQKIINIFRTKENQASSLSTKDSISKKEDQQLEQPQQGSNNQNTANHSFNKQQRNKSFDVVGIATNSSIQLINHAITAGGAINRKYSNNKGKHLQTEVSFRNNNDLSHESISDEANEQKEEDIPNTNSNRFALARKYSVQNNGRTTPQNKISINRCNRDHLDSQASVSSNTNTIERAMSFKKEIFSDNNISKEKYGKLNSNYFNSKTEQDQVDSPIAVEFSSSNDNYNYKYNSSSSKKKERHSESHNNNSSTQQMILHQIKQQQQNILQNKQSNQQNNGSGSFSNQNIPSTTQSYMNLQNPLPQNDFQQMINQPKIPSQPSISSYPSQSLISSKRVLPLTSQVNSKNGETDYLQYSSEKSANKQSNLPLSSTQLPSGGLSPPKQSKKDEDIISQDESASLSIKLRAKPKNLTKLPLKNVNQISPADYKLQFIQGSKNNTSNAKNSIPQEFLSEQKSPSLVQQSHLSQFVQPFETYSYNSGKKTFTEVSEFNNYAASNNNNIRIFNSKSNNNQMANEGFSPTKESGTSNNNFYYLGNPQYFQNNFKNSNNDKNEPHLSVTSDQPYKQKKENHSLGSYQASTTTSQAQNKNNYYISTSHSVSSSQLNNLSQKNMAIFPTSSSNATHFSQVPLRNYENNPSTHGQGSEYINNQTTYTQYRYPTNPESYQSAINQESLAEKTNSFFASNQKYIYKKHSLTSGNAESLNKKQQ